jgi:hypothetical protein
MKLEVLWGLTKVLWNQVLTQPKPRKMKMNGFQMAQPSFFGNQFYNNYEGNFTKLNENQGSNIENMI